MVLILVMFLLADTAFAQKKEIITGKVVDSISGKPMFGVSVLALNNKGGVVTKADGSFSLEVKKNTSTLVFSFVGYFAKTVSIVGTTNINVALVIAGTTQDEVVVIGYGTQKRSNVSGAVSKYKNDRLDEIAVSRLDQALQGKIAGLTVQNISSESGAAPKLSIRGVTSVNATTSPLVVVDGQPIADGLAYLNAADIESIEVLKDAASAAIYGSRGSGGVIIVTTKKGITDKPKYALKYTMGLKKEYKRYDIMTTTEYTNMLYYEMALRATDPTVIQSSNTIASGDKAAYIIENALRNGENTDWQSESLRPALIKNLQLSVSGGKKDIHYYISGGYQKDQGMMFKSNYEKLNIRAKLDFELSRTVKLTINLNPSYTTKESPSENFTNFWRFPGWLPVRHNAATAALVNTNPQYANVKAGDYAHPRHFSGLAYSGVMPDGSLFSTASANPSGSSQQNPKSSVENSDINSNEYRLQSSVELNVGLMLGLNFKALVSSYLNMSSGLEFYKTDANREGDVNYGIFTSGSNIDLLSENTLNYSKKIKGHDFSLLAGFTSQRTNINRDQITGMNFPNNDIRTLNAAAQIDQGRTFGTKNRIGLLSYLGRATYAYKSKYLLSASIRTDGSSYFAPGNKWGSFPAISLGWAASKEKFLYKVKWLTNLKLRGSYGATGNNRIADFAYLDLLSRGNYSFGAGTGTSSGGLINNPAIFGNPAITWERTFQSNFGADISLFKNKIGLTLDIYNSKTEKLLLQQSTMAFSGAPQFWNNNGSLQNRGIELELTTTNFIKRNFNWTTSANISHTQNKILELGKEAYLLNQGERAEVYKNEVGNSLLYYYGFKTDGVWLSQKDIDDAKAAGLTSNLSAYFTPGGLKLMDINGDKILDNNDRVNLGNPYPDFAWGMTNNLNYKGIELSFSLQGSQGGKLINGDPNYNESGRVIKVYNENRWISAAYPGDGKTPLNRSLGFNWMLTNYVIEDASYWAIRDINLGYRFEGSQIKKFKLTSLRVYLSAQNLYFHMAKNYRSLNPEGRAQTGPYASVLIDGYQRGTFPINRTILAGIDINF